MMDSKRQVAIIGSGPAGWAAAIYTARADLKPLLIAGDQSGGQLMLTSEVENYPGFTNGVKGPELMAQMRLQAERVGTTIVDQTAVGLNLSKSYFNVRLGNNEVAVSRAVIIATGAVANTLNLPGEERLMGRGVGTCAVCDAPFYKGKDLVVVVGGGDSAAEEAIALAKFASKVVVVVRKDQLKASQIMRRRVEKTPNVEVRYRSEIKELLGKDRLEKVRLVSNGAESVVEVNGLFYAIGHTPATSFLAGSGVELDKKGYIKTGLDFGFGSVEASLSKKYPTAASVEGVFAAGDCVDPRYRQAVTAAGYGAMAALDAESWLG